MKRFFGVLVATCALLAALAAAPALAGGPILGGGSQDQSVTNSTSQENEAGALNVPVLSGNNVSVLSGGSQSSSTGISQSQSTSPCRSQTPTPASKIPASSRSSGRTARSAALNAAAMNAANRRYRLEGPEGRYESAQPGTLGGHSKQRVYGRLDCPQLLVRPARRLRRADANQTDPSADGNLGRRTDACYGCRRGAAGGPRPGSDRRRHTRRGGQPRPRGCRSNRPPPRSLRRR